MRIWKQRLIIITLSGGNLLGVLFCMAWSLLPMYGDTLPHLIQERSGLSFQISALFVSLVTGILAVVAMFIMSFYPLTIREE